MSEKAGQEDKKPSADEYQAMVLDSLGFAGELQKAQTSYSFNMRSARTATQSGAFAEVVRAIRRLPETYLGGRPDLLFYPTAIEDDLAVKVKPFESVLSKLYRRNILYNRNWPNPPKFGALAPERLYQDVDDLLRTRLVCRYLDGPQYVCEKLDAVCKELGVSCTTRTMSTDAGYYAWHFYFQVPVELAIGGGIEVQPMWIEVQVTTQLAEVITALTHGLYEARREGLGPRDDGWKWLASSPQFRSAFIGHGLHLLEGVIQTFRDDTLYEPATAEAVEVDTPTPGVD